MIVLPDDLSPDVVALIRRVQRDLPILESPIGSNRSVEIDAMCRRWGVPFGSAWCALWAASCRDDVGLSVPPTAGALHPARAESWHVWAKKEGLFSTTPVVGAATLYDFTGSGQADHIAAAVMTLSPILMDAQGNTSLAGVSREGELTAIKPVRRECVLGYVLPSPR